MLQSYNSNTKEYIYSTDGMELAGISEDLINLMFGVPDTTKMVEFKILGQTERIWTSYNDLEEDIHDVVIARLSKALYKLTS